MNFLHEIQNKKEQIEINPFLTPFILLFVSSLIITVLRLIIRTQIFRPDFISDSRGRHFTLAVIPAETLPSSYPVVMWSLHESQCYF